MSWLDALLLALRGVRRRPGRTALTVAAVALGSGLLCALATIAQVADTRIIGELGKGGPATAIKVVAAQPDLTQPDSDAPKAGAPKDLDEAALSAIRTAQGVRSVVPVLASRLIVIPPPRGAEASTARQDPFQDTAVGVDLTGLRDLPITLLAGRTPAVGSMSEVAVTLGYLDRIGVDTQHPERVLGSEIEIGAPQVVRTSGNNTTIRGRWSRAVVTGVVAQQISDGDLLTSIELTRAERAWGLAGRSTSDLPRPTSPIQGWS